MAATQCAPLTQTQSPIEAVWRLAFLCPLLVVSDENVGPNTWLLNLLN